MVEICMHGTWRTESQREIIQNMRAPTDGTMTRETRTLEDEIIIMRNMDTSLDKDTSERTGRGTDDNEICTLGTTHVEHV